MPSAKASAITRLLIENVRAFRARTEVALGKLTLRGGATSSGKSSAMLRTLLLEQSLDSTFDSGPLLLGAALETAVVVSCEKRVRGLLLKVMAAQEVELGWALVRPETVPWLERGAPRGTVTIEGG